jgi:hypothetical protein
MPTAASLLTEDGVMTVNLFGRSSSYEKSLKKIAAAFGDEAVWAFKPTREGNTVVLAQRTPTGPKRPWLAATGRKHPNSLGPARAQMAARFQTDFMNAASKTPSLAKTAHRGAAGPGTWWNGSTPTA